MDPECVIGSVTLLYAPVKFNFKMSVLPSDSENSPVRAEVV